MLRKRLSAIATAVAVVGAMVIGVPAAHAEEADTTPPTITVISPGQNQQIPIGVNPTPTVQFKCEDDVAVETCSRARSGGSDDPARRVRLQTMWHVRNRQ